MRNGLLLVTTADERTWDTEQPMLFLGEWCRLFSKREIWDKKSNELHLYHWNDRQKFYLDYLALGELYERKLEHLAGALNLIHHRSNSLNYWRIIIGPWLRFFLDALFDRFELIRTAGETLKVSHTIGLKYELEDWTPVDFKEFYSEFTNDPWNHIVFSECIKSLGRIDLKTGDDNVITPLVPNRKSVRSDLISRYSKALPSWATKIALVSVNMPALNLFRLQAALRQPPYLGFEECDVENDKIDAKRRALLNEPDCPNSAFENLLNKLIIAWMPAAYIENFSTVRQIGLSTYPRKPKVMLTANAYQADESFKVWAAEHQARGVPLIISQHGGNMGIAKYNQSEDHQIAIADCFLTWGWEKEGVASVQPMPALQLTRKAPAFSAQGEILIIVASYPRYFYCQYSIPVANQFIEYLEEIHHFVEKLAPEPRSFARIRTTTDEFGWQIRERLSNDGLGSELDNSNASLFDRLQDCRICVSTYNATVFLETLAANFPTVIFLNPNYFEIRPEAVEMMDKLRSVGILHNTAEDAAVFLNDIADDISRWWESDRLQSARRDFCAVYAHRSHNWVSQWATFLNKMSSAN